MERRSNYNTVAVIGCQSSGKSTLLNLVFGTDFNVMREEEGRSQTTKGIWMNSNQDKSTIIFDIEGTDSKERAEQRTTFE
jgi:GTPase Era involved in 16S rRNA processing